MKNNVRQFDEIILQMYNNGYSSTYIAEHLGVSGQSIISRLRKYGVIRKNRINMIRLGDSLQKYDKEIIELYTKGFSMQHIGQILNLKKDSIRYRLHINNIEIRKTKGIKHSLRNPTITIEFFKNKIETEKDNFDYFLGILATDGNICRNQIRIGGIADNNAEFLEHWRTFLDNKVSIHRNLRKDKNTYYSNVTFKNQDIADLLSNNYGITPSKTFTVKLPYINWNILRGVFDGDGSISKDKRCNSWKFEIVSASIEFANQLYDFLKSEKLNVHLYKYGNLYEIIVLNKNDLQTLFLNMYKDCSYFLKRKYDKFLPIIQETE